VDYRTLGYSGCAVSNLCLGTMTFGTETDQRGSHEQLDVFVESGGIFVDTADVYSRGISEEIIGRWLAARPGVRDQLVIATKGRFPMGDGPNDAGLTRTHLGRALDASLSRLGVDYVDLYQAHAWDPLTPIDETLSALDDLVRAGKVRYLGSSNFTGFQIADAECTSRTRGLERFVSAQNEYSWLDRSVESDLVPALEHYGIGLLPYFPLASGLLTGKYKRGEAPPKGSRIEAWGMGSRLTETVFDVLESLEKFAAERGISLLDLAIGGLAARPAVTSVIAGATSPEQVQANVKAGNWKPSAEDLSTLEKITDRVPTP